MSYTRKTLASGKRHFLAGGQANDANDVAVQGISSGFQTVDATGTPVVSPITASATATTITVPSSAVSIIIGATTACTVSEDPAMASSLALPAGAVVTLDVAKQAALYIKGSGSVSFAFKMID